MRAMAGIAAVRCCARRPRGPTAPGWTGRYGRDQLFCGCSTRRRRTGIAATAGGPGGSAGSAGVCRRAGHGGVRRGARRRPVVSIAHPGGLRTSYEPVLSSVRPGSWSPPAPRWASWLRAIPAARPRPACTGVRCGARRPTPTTSIRSGCWQVHRFGSNRCTADQTPRACVSAGRHTADSPEFDTLARSWPRLPSKVWPPIPIVHVRYGSA